jgi:excinuclease ABC subunit B
VGSFDLQAPYDPAGDQPEAIDQLVEGLEAGHDRQTLLGVTGSGKTFTMANVIEQVNRPTLILSPNKTLAAQLYDEFMSLFPDNRVEFFISYYDYYQPEAYVPQSDTYIDKETGINDAIEQYRHSATQALAMRGDVIVVASVSCIYGLGDPDEYRDQHVFLRRGEAFDRDVLLRKLVDILYERNDMDREPGTFRAQGDTVEIASPDGETVWRIEFWGDEVDHLARIHPTTGKEQQALDELVVPPAEHFVTPPEQLEPILHNIEHELEQRVAELESRDKLVEAQRVENRTRKDLEMIREIGYCNGIENYSRHFTGREPGEPPYTLLDHFPDDFLLFVDESHVAVPQVGGMFKGDRSRKETLVEHGFRLPCALDNRPLTFEEFDETVDQAVFVSATPGPHEREVSEQIVEQIVRPTYLVDPPIDVRPREDQVDDLLAEIRETTSGGERVLVTTLTKRMAEELTTFFRDAGVDVRYLHSEVDTMERVELLEGLRQGEFDVLVGVNLLREGLDLPEVGLVAILDADREGYLRSDTALVQTMGRAARNVLGEVVLYADEKTPALQRAVAETKRRRRIQTAFNERHDVEPRTAESGRDSGVFPMPFDRDEEMRMTSEPDVDPEPAPGEESVDLDEGERRELIAHLTQRMQQAADDLEFEKAAELRDRIEELKAAGEDKVEA